MNVKMRFFLNKNVSQGFARKYIETLNMQLKKQMLL